MDLIIPGGSRRPFKVPSFNISLLAAWPCRFRSGRYTSLPPDIVSLIYHPSIFLLISPPVVFTFHPSFYHYFTIYSRPRKARICSANTVVIHWLIQQVLLLFFFTANDIIQFDLLIRFFCDRILTVLRMSQIKKIL